MSESPAIPSDYQLREQACAWIARLDTGLSEPDRRSLERWLAEDPRHGRMLVEMAKVWDDMGILSELSALFPLERYASEPRSLRGAPSALRGAPSGLRLAAVGGVLLGAVMIGWGVHEMLGPGGSAPPAIAVEPARVFETAVGERSTVRLADGSKATLNTDSLLSVRFSPAERSIEMQRGESYFEVAHDARRPFRVYVGRRVVEAVGTAFNLRMDGPNDLEVTVVEGRVRLLDMHEVATPQTPLPTRGGAQLATLAAGEMAVVDAGPGDIRRLDHGELDVRLAWQSGMIVFDGEPLEQALAEMARYTTTEFIINDESLKGLKVGGYFRAGDTSALLRVLSENFAIGHSRLSGNQIVIFDRNRREQG